METNYTLLQPDKRRFELDFKGRSRVTKSPCCGRSNSDGKFVPVKGEKNFGYCYNCGKYFLPAEKCPKCHRRTFLPYADKYTGEIVGEGCGFCYECKYNFTPSQYYRDPDNANKQQFPTAETFHYKAPATAPQPEEPPSFLTWDAVSASLRGYAKNNFVLWLLRLFDRETVSRLCSSYFVGTSKYYSGGTVFFQVDYFGNVRGGKIIQYDPATGHRNKALHPTWTHTVGKLEGFNLKQCLFGEHLLNDRPGVPVALCESEKTAVVCSVYFPGMVWVATGGKTQLPVEKLKVLQGRTVILFPDADGLDAWTDKAEQLSRMITGTVFQVSDVMRSVCHAEGTNADICDFVTQFPVETFLSLQRGNSGEATPEPEAPDPEPLNWELQDGDTREYFDTLSEALNHITGNRKNIQENEGPFKPQTSIY